ncbi:hypothetical protein Pla52o_25860 [Novipirellula galeiformis]|uniref:Uncharacterized protein n=1 Tax=Novipirellula galeiformis TaxID=2528004 RepID=A0A5C6CFW0_9BACT|nr:hypothetical protein Pla52o_25860 [Novipirellula galeiformis]
MAGKQGPERVPRPFDKGPGIPRFSLPTAGRRNGISLVSPLHPRSNEKGLSAAAGERMLQISPAQSSGKQPPLPINQCL